MTLPPDRTLAELLAAQAARHPQHPAVVSRSGSCSYAELDAAAARVAGALRLAGIGAGDTVGLLMDNRPEWLAVAYGCAAVGARLAPFNTWVKAWDLAFLLEHAHPAVLVTLDGWGPQDFVAHLEEVCAASDSPGPWPAGIRQVIVLGSRVPEGATAWEDWLAAPEERAGAVAADPDEVAMILYTSGSTARPKAVGLTHRDLIDNGFAIGERQGLGVEDRVFLASPLFWALGGANALMATLTHASTLVLQSPFEAASAIDLMEEERCTAAYLLPVMVHALLRQPTFSRHRLRSVRRGVTLGTPTEIRLAAEGLGITDICNIYGSTETYGNCCVTPHGADLARRAASQGPALPGVELVIVDEDGRPVAPGVTGEILVRGRITPGYLDDTGQPRRVTDAAGYLHTGDHGTLDGDGWLSFAARSSEMIKAAGINISPAEVEDFLLTHPAVRQAVVTGAADPERGQQVVAFVQLDPAADLDAEDIREWCRGRVAGFKVPRVVVVLDSFPTTDTGKVARRRLADMATAAVAPPGGTGG